MAMRVIATSVLGGLVGGLLGAGVMSVAHTLASNIQPPAATAAGDDATVKVADRISRAIRGRPLAEREKPSAGSAVHYGFGAVLGALYGGIAALVPSVGRGGGLLFGVAAWLGPHAIVVPALALAPSPLASPPGKEAVELVLHLLYGSTAEVVRRTVVRIAR